MKIEGEHVFHGSREQVWELVRDPSILATALPGTQELEQLSDTEYAGSINLRVGPIGGAFSGKIFVEDETPPAREAEVLDADPGVAHYSGPRVTPGLPGSCA